MKVDSTLIDFALDASATADGGSLSSLSPGDENRRSATK
jgi:hypothetical protein